MGIPRSSTLQISEIVPPTLAIGAEAASPASRRPMTIVAAFCASAEGSVKMKKKNIETQYIGLRPITSDKGAKNSGL